MDFKRFINSSNQRKTGKFKTLNIDSELHLFYKRIASHYDLPLSDLVFNILIAWKDEHHKDLEDDIKSNLH